MQPRVDMTDKPIPMLQRAFPIVLLLACGLILSRNQADPDFWGHVQYGRDAIRDGLPLTATYTYSGVGYAWINHENLSELGFAWTVDHWGPSSLLWFKTLIGVAFIGSLFVRCHKLGARRMVVVALLLLTSLNLMFFWSLRPQLFSYVGFALMIALLDCAFRDWYRVETPGPRCDYRVLFWGLPVIVGLWANAHGGFVLGLFFVGAYLGLRGIESIRRNPRTGWRSTALFAIALCVIVGVSAINPYGWRLHAWLAYALGSPRPEILEWRAPELFSILWWQWWLLVAISIAALVFSRQARDPVQCVLLAIVLWQSLAHQRHIPFFAILFASWGLRHVDSAWRRIGDDARDEPLGAGWSWCPMVAATALLAVVGTAIGWRLVEQNLAIPVARDGYPVDAFQFMADQELGGRLVARFKWAQYALATFGPLPPPHRVELAFDGRFRTCYPQQVVDRYFDFAVGHGADAARHRDVGSGPLDPEAILHAGRPDLVLIDRSQESPMRVMRGNARDWVLLYQDAIAQLWGRRTIYDEPDSTRYLPPARRHVGDDARAGHVAWPASPLFHRHAPRPNQLTTLDTPPSRSLEHP